MKGFSLALPTVLWLQRLSWLASASQGCGSVPVNRRLDEWDFDERHLSNYSLLKRKLLMGYDMNIAPKNCLVKVQAAIQSFPEISTQTQTITMSTWWRHYWVDSRLVWNPSEWGDITEVLFPETFELREIWLPDDVVYSALDARKGIEQNVVKAYSSGTVFVSFPIVHVLPCPMDLKEFPFDIQRCKITLGSWAYHGLVMGLEARGSSNTSLGAPVDLQTFKQPNDWQLQAVEVTRQVKVYSCCPEPYPEFNYVLVFQRHPLMYFCGIVLPMILVTCIGFCAFVLNPSSGERIGLGMTVVLTTAAVYLVANEAVPAIGIFTSIAFLYLVSLAFSAFTMLMSVVAVSLHCVKDSKGLQSEASLLALFVSHDLDNSGDLDKKELTEALRDMGLKDTDKLCEHVRRIRKDAISFADWYDIVSSYHLNDGHPSTHCAMYRVLLWPFMALERRFRRSVILRRRQLLSKKEKRKLQKMAEVVPVNESPRMDSLDSRDNVEPEAAGRSVLPGPSVQLPVLPGPQALTGIARKAVTTGLDAAGLAVAEGTADRKAVITSREISDPTEIVARRVAGLCDTTMVMLVPCAYFIIVLNILGGHKVWTLPLLDMPVVSYVDLGVMN